MSVAKGFVTQTAFKKHLDGDWRTVHELWSHIRNYMTSYAQPGGFTAGSVAFAGSDGFLTQDNSNFFYDNANNRLGVGIGAPVCTGHFRGAACADYAGIHSDTILLLENDDNVTLQFQCATNGEARIRFCDDDYNPSAGMIDYEFSGDEMQFGVATSIQMYLTTTGLGLGLTATNPLHVAMAGKDEGGLAGNNEVVARFRNTTSAHTGISIDALTGKDPTLFLAENGEAMWDIRNDASESDEFQIRYQGRTVVNRTDFIIDASGNVEIPTGNLSIRSQKELRFYDNGNYVGFEAPALAADQIWVLPDADGSQSGSPLVTDAAGNLSWAGAVDLGAGNFVTTGTINSMFISVETTENYIFSDVVPPNLSGAAYNILIGKDAGDAITSGDDNVIIGYSAGSALTTASDNTFIGTQCGRVATSGSNVGIGWQSLYNLLGGANNMALGYKSSFLMTAGGSNVSIGNLSLALCQTGNNNVAIGSNAAYNYTGSQITAIGSESLYNATGGGNVGIGYRSGRLVTTGVYNVVIGDRAGYSSNFSNNILIGAVTGYVLQGNDNVAIGFSCLRDGTTSIQNVVIGKEACYENVTGDDNVIIGFKSGYGVAGNSYANNIFVGSQTGYAVTTGSNNVLIGHMAGEDLTSGSGNVVIGYMAAEGQLTTGDDQLWIANSDTANPLIYGEFPNTLLRINAPLDIGRDGALRGVLTLWDGADGNTPGYAKIHSPDGTAWYIFVEDDGTVKIHNAAPAANADGDAIGDQVD